MSFVLRNRETGKYVAPPGQSKSYTARVENARRFASREAAQGEACGNEAIEEVHFHDK